MITDELIKVEVSKMLNEKLKESIEKIINDFNEENREKNGVEIETIKMQNIHYELTVRDEEYYEKLD